MKKITAFFLLLLPIFVTGLMFISGLIQNKSFSVPVAGISISESDQDVIWNQTGTEPYTEKPIEFHAHVLPLNAKNQDIQWESSNPDIVEVSNGVCKVKNYGRVTIKAAALGNKSCTATREIDSFDRVVHRVNVTNSDDIKYLSPGALAKPTIETYPTIDHIEKVDSVTYSISNDTNATIDEKTGVIKVKDSIDATKKATVTCTIESESEAQHSEKVSKSTTQEISFGPAVDSIAWVNPADETITTNTYTLFNNFKTAPAVQKTTDTPEGTIEVSDFIYESQNPTIATVDSQTSEVTFLKPNEYATFLITYKRNPDLKISKRIQTTDNDFKQVFFKDASLDVDYDTYKNQNIALKDDTHPTPILDWITYPEKSEFNDVNIASTDSNVIEINSGNGRPEAIVKNTGKCSLKIYTQGNEVFSDVCEIYVKPSASFLKSDTVTTDEDTPWYYPLINNINVAQSSLGFVQATFDMPESSNAAYIDDNNILHFNKPGTNSVKINATINGETKQFTVTQHASLEKQLKSEDFDTIVGQPIEYTNDLQPIFEGKYYESYFDIDTENKTFTAKRGCSISDFELSNGKKINFVVREDPIYITTSTNSPLYSTPNTEVDFLNTFDPKVFPSSATKSDGSIYEPIFDYDQIGNETIYKVDENVINFSRIGTCSAIVNFGYINGDITKPELTNTYHVRSTFNDAIGKFKVTTNELLPAFRTTMNQYDKWNINNPLRIDNVSHSLYEGLQIKSMNGLCNPTISWSGLLLTGHVRLDANPISGKYGKDVIEISSPTYSLFLNVEIDPFINDFTVTFKNDVWDENTINTYTNTLSNIRVTPDTTGIKELDWSWRLTDSEGATISSQEGDENGSASINITTPTTAGTYNLILSVAGKDIKQYTINYKTTTPKVTLYGAEDGIYASCNSDTKSTMIVPDGYVDDSFYADFDKSEVTGGPVKSINGNIITISGISEETSNATFTLKNGKDDDKKIEKTYPIGRDQVSRIKLPGHDILDQSDKRGMQKVHVYGNYSYYPGVGEVNYYKVPVKLYNKARKEIGDGIEDPEQRRIAKVNALKSLKITVGRNSSHEIDPSGDYIRVYLNKNDLYTPQEIYNNAFDTKTGKNINFQVATKSNEVHADYKFVAVEGTNVWNQEALLKLKNKQLKVNIAVLQKNFGLMNEETSDNAIFNDWTIDDIYGVYGNGYALNLQYIARKKVLERDESLHLGIFLSFNVDINGGDSETLLARRGEVKLSVTGDKTWPGDRYFAYSNLHNMTAGMNAETDQKIFIKRCLFHSYWQETFFMNGFSDKTVPNFYIEESDFFDCGKFPIWAMNKNPFYFKGEIKVYNFKDKEMLRDVGGASRIDATQFWQALLTFARANNMTHIDYKGDEVVNCFMCTVLNPYIHFWDFNKNEYVKSERGIPGSAKYLAKYAELGITLPFVGKVAANMWGGTNPSYEPGAPKYYDEFDTNGKINYDFLNELIIELTRHPKYF